MVDLAEKAREIQKLVMIKREEIGREEGRKEGVELGQTKTAIKLKKMGISVEIIMEATGLDREQVEQLEE